jgi:hypothetical protein
LGYGISSRNARITLSRWKGYDEVCTLKFLGLMVQHFLKNRESRTHPWHPEKWLLPRLRTHSGSRRMALNPTLSGMSRIFFVRHFRTK